MIFATIIPSAIAAYVVLGVLATFVLWPRAHDGPPTDGDLTMLLRMVGMWWVYVGIELAGLGAEALAAALRWRMRGAA